MTIRVVRLGSARANREGVRLGTVRRPPRGVRKADFARRNYYDLWLPDLAPSEPLFRWAIARPWTDQRWRQFSRRYLHEMKAPPAQRLLSLLTALSRQANLSVGCYCEDESRCHRSLLRKLLSEHGARID